MSDLRGDFPLFLQSVIIESDQQANTCQRGSDHHGVGMGVGMKGFEMLISRETPPYRGHLRAMVAVAKMRSVTLPPFPSFYHEPVTIQDIVDQRSGSVLDQFKTRGQLFNC